MSGVSTFINQDGATIFVCTDHGEQSCPFCCLMFSEINNEARQEARKRKAIKPPQTPLGEGLLISGTEVRMLDRSGENVPPNHLEGRIGGVLTEKDEESDFDGMECYVVEYGRRNGEVMTQVMTYPVEWVHEEWQVKTNGQWVSAMKYVKLFSGDDSDNDDDM
ncbi:hypothetical protein R1flu_028856 [Riccia fluitans]|uniref:Uncharacterized protein n=1 Tax=Riccia fluitans TaxID=41844 RepID=A0ABD1XMV1_9MARC